MMLKFEQEESRFGNAFNPSYIKIYIYIYTGYIYIKIKANFATPVICIT